MSYSCADFVNDCEANAEAYELPDLSAADLSMLDIPEDPEERGESEHLRALAARVAGAMSDRQELLRHMRAVLESCYPTASTEDYDQARAFVAKLGAA